ncbi:MAG TPA: outer membrane beta-barrel protein [Candidatus Eisenbacteria bacterium]|nr:outer membrane beta-barrel protein [Candidatus Eisenbacteria bacterium]
MRSMIVAFAAVALVAAAPAFAGGDKGQIEIGGYGGWFFPDDYGQFHPDKDNIWGGRLGYWFTQNWTLEGSYQKVMTDTEMNLIGVPEVDVDLASYRLNLLYNLGSAASKARLFVTAGAGSEKTDIDTYVDENKFGWNVGGGLRFFLSRNFNLRFDGRFASVKAVEGSGHEGNGEATVGLGFLFGGHKEEAAAEVIPPPANQPPTVSCAADRGQILPGETATITATAADPEGGPLTYDWTATGGARVTGTGPSATLDFSGATPPATAAISVKVTDDHGQSASSDCTVALMAPAKPPEAVSCISTGFPKNASRLNNVDKACLDDVDQRLKADPRARVVVIGHSDTKETTKNIAQARAEAVRDYLVRERGIDTARIEVRAATATAGADVTAQTSNRRVEVWFVPEGASVPGM